VFEWACTVLKAVLKTRDELMIGFHHSITKPNCEAELRKAPFDVFPKELGNEQAFVCLFGNLGE